VIGGRIEADGVGRGGVHLADGVDEDVGHEVVRLRVARQADQVLAQQGIGAAELRERSSAARSRATRTVSSRRSRCRAAPTRPAAISSADTMEESNSRTRCQSSKPMAPTYSPSTMMGTMAEVRALSLVMLTLSKPCMVSGQNTMLLPDMSIEQSWSDSGSSHSAISQQVSVSSSLTHSALILSHFSPLGPTSEKARAVRSTWAASPRTRSTSGMAFMTSGEPSNSRLARAEAASNRSRCCRDW
jgi:hypothetical protein